jgi:hypothetical protein
MRWLPRTTQGREAWDMALDCLCYLVLWVFIVALGAYAIALLTGCQTYAAVVSAPEEFWMTTEEILGALLRDIWAIIEAIL